MDLNEFGNLITESIEIYNQSLEQNFAHTVETAAEVLVLNWFDDILQRDYSEIESATTTQSSIIEREEAGENIAWLDNLVNEAANVSAQSDCGSCKTIDIIMQEKTDDEFMNVQPTIGIANEVASVSVQSDCGILKKKVKLTLPRKKRQTSAKFWNIESVVQSFFCG